MDDFLFNNDLNFEASIKSRFSVIHTIAVYLFLVNMKGRWTSHTFLIFVRMMDTEVF